MIQLHPIPSVEFDCPLCHSHLRATGWYMPGMRVLATLHCDQCGRSFYGDLATGHGILYGALLEINTAEVFAISRSGFWFADELKDTYSARIAKPVKIVFEKFRLSASPIILNCLDSYYGHCLEKLLNAEYYIENGADLIVIIPTVFRWLVPDGVAEIWTVDLPLREGNRWNDWLGEEFHKCIEAFENATFAIAFPEPHPGDYNIERFTRVTPFSADEWNNKSLNVTFIWREDRLWYEESKSKGIRQWHRVARKMGWRPSDLGLQQDRVNELARLLREKFPDLKFSVAGFGTFGHFDPMIEDMRVEKITEETEKEWCEQYAKSHLVIGVHGSNMLLPSAHSGAVIDLLPEDRIGNIGQDIIPVGTQTEREIIFRYRFLPLLMSVEDVSKVSVMILEHTPLLVDIIIVCGTITHLLKIKLQFLPVKSSDNIMSTDLPPQTASDHYVDESGRAYFSYQNQGGLQQGAIEARKFAGYIKPSDVVIDFGCGSGATLANLQCARRIGIEINPAAREECAKNNIEAYPVLDAVSDEVAHVVVSNHALEHVENPLATLKQMRAKLQSQGKLFICVPIDDWRTELQVDVHDINHHLYTWTPLLMGNLLVEAGFEVQRVTVLTHAWPPNWQVLDRRLPIKWFDRICFAYSFYKKRRQIFAEATKGNR